MTEAAIPGGGTEVLDPPGQRWPLDSPAFHVMNQTWALEALDRARAGQPS